MNPADRSSRAEKSERGDCQLTAGQEFFQVAPPPAALDEGIGVGPAEESGRSDIMVDKDLFSSETAEDFGRQGIDGMMIDEDIR